MNICEYKNCNKIATCQLLYDKTLIAVLCKEHAEKLEKILEQATKKQKYERNNII